MIKITESALNKVAYKSLRQIEERTRSGIRKAWYELGKDLKQESKRLITEPPKTGRIYRIRRKGKTVIHQASAPGESPANLTGALKKSVNYNVSSTSELVFGANTKYARRLELGDSKIKKRPYLKRAIDEKEGEAYTHLCSNIEKELCRK